VEDVAEAIRRSFAVPEDRHVLQDFVKFLEDLRARNLMD